MYVHDGYNVIIDCKITNGSIPITRKWFLNESPYPTINNALTITITDANNGDVFKCKVRNFLGFDSEKTTIHEFGE